MIKPLQNKFLILALLIAGFAGLCGCNKRQDNLPVLKVAIAPYQDMAMLMSVTPLGLDKKQGMQLQILSMVWQDLTPAVASATPSVDLAFASLIQFISQEHSLNAAATDPVVFFYPAYVFKGGAFVSFNQKMPVLSKADLSDAPKVKSFLGFRFAAQKTSSYEMLLAELARGVGLKLKDVKLTDMGAEDGLLAAEHGSVDATSAGLTQKSEALKRDGRVVLEMTDLGQVDIAGFIAKRSVLQNKRQQILAFLRIWAETCAYTLSDLKDNSRYPLEYLRTKSSTQYTVDSFANALGQEVFPITSQDMYTKVIAPGSPFDYRRVVSTTVAYYLETRQLKEPPRNIDILDTK